MRRPRQKSRSIRDRDGESVSLFPFLAVLISTMGALILLLVVFSRQARLQAAQAAVARIGETTELQEDLERARGMAAWEKDELKKSREKTDAQLAQARLALGHIEDHTRRLGEEFSRLESDWAELDRYETEGGRRHEQSQARLAEIESQLDLARQKLDLTRDRAQLAQRSFAVIPYQGPNGTRRRPIYIECRSDSVVLQPEGIVFTAADFVGPNGPGNPLEVAIRAIREYIQRTETVQNGSWSKKSSGTVMPSTRRAVGATVPDPFSHQARNGEQPTEPYPLLLVRPSGIEAYSHARDAMESWGSDFGYELIEDDWKVEFDEPDPELARQVAEVVATARKGLASLARAAPGLYGGSQAPTYVAKPRGGVMRIGGHDREAGDTGQPSGGSGWGRPPTSLPGTSADQGGGNAGPDGTQPETSGGTSAARNPLRGDGQREPSPYGQSGVGRGKSDQVNGAIGGEKGDPSAAGGFTPRPGEWTGPSTASEASQSNQPPNESSASPLAGVRGKNWALPDAANGSVGITRPIRVNCYPDRLELIPQVDRNRPRIVSLAERTEDTLDTFVSAVWDHMKSWGIAGRGMYWQPILDVHVAPGAEPRFADLNKLLDRSGLAVRRRE